MKENIIMVDDQIRGLIYLSGFEVNDVICDESWQSFPTSKQKEARIIDQASYEARSKDAIIQRP